MLLHPCKRFSQKARTTKLFTIHPCYLHADHVIQHIDAPYATGIN